MLNNYSRICVIGFFVFFASRVDAQDLFELSLEELLDLKVTSTSYFDETLRSSVSSVTVVEGEMFRDQSSRNVGELLNTMPSTIAPFVFGQSRLLAIRGYLGDSSATNVAVSLDEVPMNKLRQGSALMEIDGLDLQVLDSVELIRGPSSVLHGSNAFHGVLSFNTLDPEDTGNSLHAEAGTDEYSAASGTLHESWGDQSITVAVAYRKFGDADQDYVYTDFTDGLDKSSSRSLERESNNLLLKYSAGLGDSLTIDLTGYFLEFDSNQLPGTGESLGASIQLDGDWSNYDSETRLFKAKASYETLDYGSFESFIYFWSNEDALSADFLRSVSPTLVEEWRSESHWGTRLLHRLEFLEVHQLAYGYEFSRSEMDDFKFKNSGLDGSIYSEGDTRDEVGYKRDVNSLFFDGRWKSKNLKLDFVYGLRFDDYKDLDNQWSPRLAVIKEIGDYSSLKFSYGHAYRAPNLLELYGSPYIESNFDLQPEQLDSVQLVYQLEGDNSLHTITFFRDWWSDAISRALISNENGEFVTQNVNSGKRESIGIELESTFQWEAFQLGLSTSYIRSKKVDEDEDFESFPYSITNLSLGYIPNKQTHFFLHNRLMFVDSYSSTLIEDYESYSAATYFRTDLVCDWQAQNNLFINLTIRNIFDRDNTMVSGSTHIRGLEDSDQNVSVSLTFDF